MPGDLGSVPAGSSFPCDLISYTTYFFVSSSLKQGSRIRCFHRSYPVVQSLMATFLLSCSHILQITCDSQQDTCSTINTLCTSSCTVASLSHLFKKYLPS